LVQAEVLLKQTFGFEVILRCMPNSCNLSFFPMAWLTARVQQSCNMLN